MTTRTKIRFERDPLKAKRNVKKHKGVSFDLAERVFDDPFAKTQVEGTDHGELRWQTIGEVAGRLLVVSHTIRQDTQKGEDVIRIISARKATRSERQEFEDNV